MTIHHTVVCHEHYERYDIGVELIREEINIAPLVEKTIKMRKMPNMEYLHLICVPSWVEGVLVQVLKFCSRHNSCKVVLISDYQPLGDIFYYFHVNYRQPYPSKEEYEERKKSIIANTKVPL